MSDTSLWVRAEDNTLLNLARADGLSVADTFDDMTLRPRYHVTAMYGELAFYLATYDTEATALIALRELQEHLQIYALEMNDIRAYVRSRDEEKEEKW